MKKFLFLVLLHFISNSQEKSDFKIDFSGFIETYYAYDFNRPSTETRLPFTYNHNRHNEFNVNIGLLRAKLQYDNAYANIALQSGTYVDDNYANEKIKYLNEALVGLYLDKAKKNSIEVGILPSYIGFESAATASNLTLTRSLLAENSPYFMTGLKYNYKPNTSWSFSAFVTNGWQRIRKAHPSIAPSVGTQILVTPTGKTTLNWSTFVGKESFGEWFSMRYFSNLYWDQKWTDTWRTIVGFDCGLQQRPNTGDNSKTWFSPVVIAQYTVNTKWQIAVRSEYYIDKENAIIATALPFSTFGNSVNIDFLPNAKIKFRTEAKYFNASEQLFEANHSNSNFCLTTGISFEF